MYVIDSIFLFFSLQLFAVKLFFFSFGQTSNLPFIIHGIKTGPYNNNLQNHERETPLT